MASHVPLSHGRMRLVAYRVTATLLFLASFFVVKPIWRAFDIHGPWRMVFLLIPLAGMVLFFRASRWGKTGTDFSPAVERFLNRLFVCMTAYLALLVAAQLGKEVFGLSGTVLAVLRVLPAIPMIGCIFAMGRYLAEEQDEYQRLQAARASLFATGLLLTVAMIWGFLEQAGLVRHVPASSAFIVWAMGLGIVRCLQQVRAR